MMEIIYRRLRLDDDAELRSVCSIDITIPAMFDSDFRVDEQLIVDRMSDLQKRFGSEDFLEIAVSLEEVLVGFHIVKRSEFFGKRVGHIYTLWVSPEFRNRGIASTLKQRSEDWARNSGLDFFETWVHADNSRMIELNQNNGFEVVGLKMKKTLK